MFYKTLIFCGLLVIAKAMPEPLIEIIEPVVDDNETDRNWFTDWFKSDPNIETKVNIVLNTPGHAEYSFHINDRDIVSQMRAHGFDPARPTKIVTHGFVAKGEKFCPPFVEAYFTLTNAPNVICIDWSALNAPWDGYMVGTRWYTGPARYAIKIGKSMGPNLVKAILVDKLQQNPSNIHAIGHSLGAHLVGNMARSSGVQINRVTGLDPAMPFFRNYPLSSEGVDNKLRRTDARFVDIIHSNSGELPLHLSFPDPLGDMDFYPNGGESQPTCGKNPKCSHSMATKFYVDSIRNLNYGLQLRYFTSERCSSYANWNKRHCVNDLLKVPMGEPLLDYVLSRRINYRVSLRIPNMFFLKTKDTSKGPFSLH